jgi:thiamine pyrophosphate-dependent acetolactate synthase large subunit-like protein
LRSAWQDARVPTGAEVIVAQLEDAGVEICFGLPGVHNLPLWEALRESPIRLVGVRHEQAAAYAADGFARATGKLGVALTTTGPGAANTLGAVGEAWASRSPIVVIATDIPSGLRRPGVYRGVLHETCGQAEMFAPVVRSCHVVSVAGEVEPMTAAALAARGGPSYLEVPTDLLAGQANGASKEPGPADSPVGAGDRYSPSGASERSPAAAGDPYPLIDAAERPLIWAGSGARDRADEVRALAERLAAPVLTTYGGRGVLPPGHPCNVGMPPHVPAAGRLWDEADLVISFGSDLDGMNTQNWLQPQPPHVVAVNIDAEDASKNYAVDAVTAGLDVERIRQRDGDVAPRLRAVRAEACRELDARALRFLDAVSYALPDEANVVCDMCIPGYWIAGFHGFHRPRKLQYPMGWGTLGFAFPAALGASLAGTGPTVSISGDGGFLFACGELATMAQERLPFTAVIVDDGGYGMLRYDQQLTGAPPYGVDLATPDFAALAESFGVRAETVEGLDDAFGEALGRHVEDPEPSVLVARAEALVPPPTTSPNWYRKRAAS